MRIRNIDGNNDWRFGKGQSDYVTGAYAVGLDIKLRLQEWPNDCFFALQNGIEWNRRLGEYNQKVFLDGDIRRIASETTGVLEIVNFESYLVNRKYTCSFNVYQQYSTELLPIKFEMGV